MDRQNHKFWKFIYCDAGANTWRDKDVSRYQQQGTGIRTLDTLFGKIPK